MLLGSERMAINRSSMAHLAQKPKSIRKNGDTEGPPQGSRGIFDTPRFSSAVDLPGIPQECDFPRVVHVTRAVLSFPQTCEALIVERMSCDFLSCDFFRAPFLGLALRKSRSGSLAGPRCESPSPGKLRIYECGRTR